MNRLHSLWVEQAGDNHYQLFYQVHGLSGTPLSPAAVVRESRYRIRRPHVVVEADQTAHLLWQERFSKVGGAKNPEGTWVHYARFAPSSGPAALLHHAILNERPLAQHPGLAVDNGAAYVVWEEGADTLILARVTNTQRPVDYRRIASAFNAGRSFPSIAVNKGMLHVAWTAARNTQREILHAMLPLADFGGAFRSTEAVYASASSASQPKYIRVEANGQVTIVWKNLREEGPIGWLAADDHSQSVTFSPGVKTDGPRQIAVRDQTLTTLLKASQLSMPVVITAKPSLSKPSVSRVAQTLRPSNTIRATLERFDESIVKLRRAHLLAFTSWSSAPPSLNETTAFFPPVLTAFPLLPATKSFQGSYPEARSFGFHGMVSLG